ncbi:inactive ubiquitin carboxyl-terminal hydrolase MINDY-4B [Columba livia]|uniref:inactive ubiquitin carboxyl-terminal hydrolase MINDY-4B n=1 Tax=Columba livia TaxID=8932 RepID=UPI0031BBAE11
MGRGHLESHHCQQPRSRSPSIAREPMGDRGAEPAAPRTELEEITSKISDLNKWREIFNFHGGLRQLLFGNVSHRFSCEWTQACFRFREPYSDLAYALEAEERGTRAVLMAVQAHIIKYLLFVRNTEYTHLERLCRISRREQGTALAAALADTLWAAGGGRMAIICLITTAVHTAPSRDHRADSFTERVQLFEFGEKAAAQEFIFDHINCFRGEGSHGVILYLYSLLFSRTLERLQEDLGCTATPLLKSSSGNITCTEALLSLLLRGRAIPCELDVGHEPWRGGVGGGDGGAKACRRSPVGYLRRDRAPAEPQVCRGLRTPRLPVWLCGTAGRHGVLFSTDMQLLRDWRVERRFPLLLCSGRQAQSTTARLTVGTDPHTGHMGWLAHTDHVWPAYRKQHTSMPCEEPELGSQHPSSPRRGSPGSAAHTHHPAPSASHLKVFLQGLGFLDLFLTVFPLQTLTHTPGKRTEVKTRGRGVRPWRWPSGASGQGRPSPGMGLTPSSEDPTGQTPSSEDPTGLTPSSQDPMGLTPSSEDPTGQTSSSQDPMGLTPSSEDPTGQTPSSEDPMGLTPSSQDPMGLTPSSEDPTGQTPSSQDPTGQTPSSQDPTGQTPSSERPNGTDIFF